MTTPGSTDAPPANTGDGGQGGQGMQMFTQEQVNAMNANTRRSALDSFFKDLGLPKAPTAEELKTTLANAQEFSKLKDGEKGDVERLTGEVNKYKPLAEQRETELSRAKIAADSGLKSRYWKYIEGDTEEDIQGSVKAILDDLGQGGDGSGSDEDGDGGDVDEGEQEGQGQQQQRRGTGSRLTPNPQQGRPGGQPKKTLAAGAEAYRAKHPKQE